MINKKGLSDVVATVLIILLALAAVVIVWSFVSPSLKNTGTQIDVQSKCLATELKPTSCNVTNPGGNAIINVQLTRGGEEGMLMKGILKNDNGVTSVGNSDSAPTDVLETERVEVDFVSLSGSSYTATVAAVFNIEGKEYVCSESPTVVACA